jgi:hypothetical protein
MNELTIEKMEMVSGGRCTMEEMMGYGFLTSYYAGSSPTLSFFYGAKLTSCMAQM